MASPSASKSLIHCSFCGKSQDAVAKVVAGPNGVSICNGCIDRCYQLVHTEQTAPSPRG